MTYKQAKTIQSIVFDLNCMNTDSTYECSVEPMTGTEQYYCYLYSYEGSLYEFTRLYQLAVGMFACVDGLCYSADRTSIQLKDEYRMSIRMW